MVHPEIKTIEFKTPLWFLPKLNYDDPPKPLWLDVLFCTTPSGPNSNLSNITTGREQKKLNLMVYLPILNKSSHRKCTKPRYTYCFCKNNSIFNLFLRPAYDSWFIFICDQNEPSTSPAYKARQQNLSKAIGIYFEFFSAYCL